METDEKMLDRQESRISFWEINLIVFCPVARVRASLPLRVFRIITSNMRDISDSVDVKYLLKLVDNLCLKCFLTHWATSSRHGPLFSQQCSSPTRCYGKFGSHNGSDSVWSVIISVSRLSWLSLHILPALWLKQLGEAWWHRWRIFAANNSPQSNETLDFCSLLWSNARRVFLFSHTGKSCGGWFQ